MFGIILKELKPCALGGVREAFKTKRKGTGCYEVFYRHSKRGGHQKSQRYGRYLRRDDEPQPDAKEGRDFGEVIREIASIVDGPISGEVKATTEDAAGMIAEGREIAAIHPNMVVKIPMTVEGLKATKVLSAEGIKCNVTLIFSANQALLAARAGAAYVSPFLGRLDDISMPGIDLVRTIADMFALYDDIHTEIIAASVRNPVHVTDCALAGADIATVPYSVIEQMTKHPLTDAGIAKFRADYEKVFGK